MCVGEEVGVDVGVGAHTGVSVCTHRYGWVCAHTGVGGWLQALGPWQSRQVTGRCLVSDLHRRCYWCCSVYEVRRRMLLQVLLRLLRQVLLLVLFCVRGTAAGSLWKDPRQADFAYQGAGVRVGGWIQALGLWQSRQLIGRCLASESDRCCYGCCSVYEKRLRVHCERIQDW